MVDTVSATLDRPQTVVGTEDPSDEELDMANATKRRPAPSGPLKSIKDYRPASGPSAPDASDAAAPRRSRLYDPVRDRETQRDHFRLHLESTVSKRGKPYSAKTVGAYCEAVRSLGVYLTEIGFPRGFEAVDHLTLNGYLAWYRDANDQGGTVTKQGNLRVFFAYVADAFAVQDAYLHPKRNVYRREETAPPVLPQELLHDLLAVTTGKSFEHLRDNLIIRLFIVGPRNCEMAALQCEHLDVRSKVVWFSPFKGASMMRPVPVAPTTLAVALKYLRARAALKSRPDESGALFLSAKGGTPLTTSGIYQMVKRRAAEAGWDPADIHPHLFRHTTADAWLANGGSEGDLMALLGWRDRSMLDRYGASNRQQRAVAAAQRAGFGEVPGRRGR